MRNIRKLRLESSSCQVIVLVVLVAVTRLEAGRASPRYTRRNLPGKAAIFLPRMRNGRNSKVNTEIPVWSFEILKCL